MEHPNRVLNTKIRLQRSAVCYEGLRIQVKTSLHKVQCSRGVCIMLQCIMKCFDNTSKASCQWRVVFISPQIHQDTKFADALSKKTEGKVLTILLV
jgi:hypothetical protein